MRQRISAIAALVLTVSGVSPVQAFDVGVQAYYWITEVEGNIRVDKGSIKGSKIDVQDDLEIDEDKFPIIEIFADLGKHHLSMSYHKLDFNGENVLEEEIIFNGKIFEANEQVKTDVETSVFDVKYQYDLLAWDNILAGFSAELVARVQLWDGDVELKSEATGTSRDFSEWIPFGGLDLGLDVLLNTLSARVLATGGYYQGPWFDGQVDLYFSPWSFLAINGGYRIVQFDTDLSNVELNDFRIAGPYLGLALSF